VRAKFGDVLVWLREPKFPSYRRIVGYSWIGKRGLSMKKLILCVAVALALTSVAAKAAERAGDAALGALSGPWCWADRCGGRRRRGLYGGSAYRGRGLPSIIRPWRAAHGTAGRRRPCSRWPAAPAARRAREVRRVRRLCRSAGPGF